ncbi:MAG: AAA family ATPase, partial [Pseudoruegeria sp.]
MRFTRLRLNGFKSFVDPTDLVIADGLTGVVGPNGCGKSNLLEALRWVMGENRPTAMRGGGMEDVIFAGAATRPARNFAEVTLQLDNSDRLAPAGFNDLDTLEIVRRITRDAGSAYKSNTKDVRARDIQMLFADASTGAHSPALVRQGQISELINAKPKNRRRILEEAAGISGLYQRRHEAELKLKGTETNLARVEDVVEQLAQQLGQLARQARQAQRYRTIGDELRQSEGLLLYRRWKEAEEARAASQAELTERVRQAGQAEVLSREAVKKREESEAGLPALREEEAIAAAILQRLQVQRDTLKDEEARAVQTIDTLTRRIEQLVRDIAREGELNRDAGETIARLEWEQDQIGKASDGQGDKLSQASDSAAEAAQILQDREAASSQLTEDVARLAARHQSATRLLEDSRRTLERNEAEAAKAEAAVATSQEALEAAEASFEDAEAAQDEAAILSEDADVALEEADIARHEAQAREADARAELSEAEGESSALRAEVGALARLVERDTAEGGQVLDHVRVTPGYEKALGAALADDLRAPVVGTDMPSGWATLPGYPQAQLLPDGIDALTNNVTVPEVLVRRMGQVGLVDRVDGASLQATLKPGQRLVSIEGDLWRWDGFRAGAEDAPSAAALRLQQLNRLVELKRDLEEVSARSEGARQAHELLTEELRRRTQEDQAARDARRNADRAVADAGRALSKFEADRNIAQGRLESLGMAVSRHKEEALGARQRLTEAERGADALEDLEEARARVEDVKMTVEASRMTMMAKRSAHDELRREGEARVKRSQEITKEISGWRHRLDTAEKRIAELEDRKLSSEDELQEAKAAPEEIAIQREELADAIEEAEARKATASDALISGEGALREALTQEREAERLAGEAREARARSEARADAARETERAASDRIGEDMETTPQDLLEALQADPDKMPSAEHIEAEVNRLKRQRDALGAVNLRAEEDAREVQDEHDHLVQEKS